MNTENQTIDLFRVVKLLLSQKKSILLCVIIGLIASIIFFESKIKTKELSVYVSNDKGYINLNYNRYFKELSILFLPYYRKYPNNKLLDSYDKVLLNYIGNNVLNTKNIYDFIDSRYQNRSSKYFFNLKEINLKQIFNEPKILLVNNFKKNESFDNKNFNDLLEDEFFIKIDFIYPHNLDGKEFIELYLKDIIKNCFVTFHKKIEEILLDDIKNYQLNTDNDINQRFEDNLIYRLKLNTLKEDLIRVKSDNLKFEDDLFLDEFKFRYVLKKKNDFLYFQNLIIGAIIGFLFSLFIIYLKINVRLKSNL